jgi:hypothetical protein
MPCSLPHSSLPLAQTKVSDNGLAMRDQKFERYNSRPQVVPPYSPHYLDPYEQGAKKGAWSPHVLAIENKQSYMTWTWTWTWQDLWAQKPRWIDVLIVVLALCFGVKACLVLISVLSFLFRVYVVGLGLFLLLLLTLVI